MALMSYHVSRSCLILKLAAGAAVLLLGPANVNAAEQVRVDCSQRVGRVRALHGVNNGPVNCGETVDLSAYYRAAKFPLARLHDSGWPNPDIVDIHAIFPDLRADPASPASYRFSRTDDYIQAIVKTNVGIVYRLGESIEHTRKKYNVAPPADYDKWAAACVGIIRHYNEGWAKGFRHNIRYWEIWNEPENRPPMWTGTDADYYRLYATASRAIKARFPNLMVGGPSLGATGPLVDGRLKPTKFLTGFLSYCKEHKLPLDFFSWHTYTDNPYVYAQKAHAMRKVLDEYGFRKTENHLNEWNYLPDNDWRPIFVAGQGIMRQRWIEKMGGSHGAAFVTCALIYLQDSPLDVANYYSGDTNLFGLFNRFGVPKKTFHAMRAFQMLMETPLRLKASGSRFGQTAFCAGISQDGASVTILVSNFRSQDTELSVLVGRIPWQGSTRWEVLRLDAKEDLKSDRSGTLTGRQLKLKVECKAPCVLVIKLTGGPARPNTVEAPASH